MATQTQALINGNSYAYSAVQFEIFGAMVTGVRALDYKEKQDKKDQYASGTEPSSRVYGTKEYSGSIELEMKEVERIRDAMVGSKSLLDIPPFTITVSFLRNSKLVTHKLLNCEFMEDGNSLKTGEAVNAQLPIIFAGIEYN